MFRGIKKTAAVFFLFVLCIPFLFNPVKADESSTWLDGYGKRVLFYWESSGAGQDSFTVYNQTGINNNAKFYVFNEIQTDFRDVRVTLNDGETLLPIWNQTTIEQTSVKVWCNFPTANISYYLYWNNPNASLSWNQSTVFNDILPAAVGLWAMNDAIGSSVLTDSSGNSNNAVLYGTSVIADPVFIGKNARSFNGVSDYAIVSDADREFNLRNSFTAVVWGKLNAVSAHSFIWKGLSAYNPVFGIGQTSSSSSSLAFVGNSSGRFYVNYALPSLNSNVFMVETFNGTSVNAYVNGSYVASLPVLAPLGDGGTNALAIGARNSTTDGLMRLNGVISYIAIFADVLTDEEINNLYLGFGDAEIETGKVLIRSWITGNSIGLFGVVESAPDPDFISGEDAAGIAVFFGVVAIAFCVALVFGKRK